MKNILDLDLKLLFFMSPDPGNLLIYMITGVLLFTCAGPPEGNAVNALRESVI